ncbi:Uncharacterised protein [Vibrio cholerae]|nr:Uncharacterised protein [Vibrio cholerae]
MVVCQYYRSGIMVQRPLNHFSWVNARRINRPFK